MRRALLLLAAPVAVGCTLVRDLDDLPGDAPGTGGACGFSASGGSSAGGDNPGDPVMGCSDGSRELFINAATYPDIAGCSGGFSVPGLVNLEAGMPSCGRNAGNDGLEPIGWGCSAADLCSVGWHVCGSAAELAMKSSTGVCATETLGFWATRQSQDDDQNCVAAGTNNLVGCGNGIGEAAGPTCAPLALELRDLHCNVSCAWICDGSGIFDEAVTVQKYGSEDGGVLCCSD